MIFSLTMNHFVVVCLVVLLLLLENRIIAFPTGLCRSNHQPQQKQQEQPWTIISTDDNTRDISRRVRSTSSCIGMVATDKDATDSPHIQEEHTTSVAQDISGKEIAATIRQEIQQESLKTGWCLSPCGGNHRHHRGGDCGDRHGSIRLL